MSEWKWVFHNYQVQECDEFARYLESMARQGWHFKEWKNRLGFEKGEAEEAVYDVQVFSKARTNDLKAEGETLVYSDFCQAAGWELVDSKGKFCIFKQIQDDAVPIVTDEEKIDSVGKAYHKLIGTPVLFTFLSVFQIMTFLGDPEFELFDSMSLFSDVLWICFTIYSWIRYGAGLIEEHKAVKCYEETGELFFGRKVQRKTKLIAGYPLASVVGLALLFVVYFIAFAFWGGRDSLFFFVAALFLIFGISLWNQNARPGRKERTFSTVFMVVMFLLLMIIFIIWGVWHRSSESVTMSSQTAFGYCEEGPDYTRYHWKSWVPDGVKDWVWKSTIKDVSQNEDAAALTESCHAQECTGDGDPYYLKYENDIIHIWTYNDPAQQQINDLLEKDDIQ